MYNTQTTGFFTLRHRILIHDLILYFNFITNNHLKKERKLSYFTKKTVC